MTDFSTMTGQELCQWLQEHGAFVGAKVEECVLPNGLYNLWACAGAARDHVKSQCLGQQWQSVLYETAEYGNGHQMDFDDLVIDTSSIDWLRAAAKVIEGNLTGSTDAHQPEIH